MTDGQPESQWGFTSFRHKLTGQIVSVAGQSEPHTFL